MADFDPRELDRLEDLLEDLDVDLELGGLGLSPAMAGRLAEYQGVLALCRDALPSESPREDLLGDVLAEAHAVSRRPKLRESDGGRWRQTWERWRGTLIPSLALAGTAALVLVLLDPDRNLERSDELLTDSSQTAERESSGEADTTPSEPASEPSIDDTGSRDSSPEPEPIVEVEDRAPLGTAGSKPAKSIKPKSKPINVAPITKPATAPLSKDETWTTLERANADRRKGDCDRARTRYEQVIDSSSDSVAIARAKAGVGLCLEQDRRTSEADEWFSDARSTNPGIDAWIETQRDDQPAPGEAKKSKPMPAGADALDSL